MRLLDTYMQWAGTDLARLGAVADQCRALALEHCRHGQLYHACGWSATANRIDKLAGALSDFRAKTITPETFEQITGQTVPEGEITPPSAAPTVQELEREYCDRKGVSVYCKECRSYHSTPRNFELWQALRCRRPWGEWTRKATPEEIAEFRGEGGTFSEK